MAESKATTLELAIRDKMLSNPKINDAVNGRIYLGHVPQNTTIPQRLIIVTDFDRRPHYHLGGETQVSTSSVQIDVYATDPGGYEFIGNGSSSIGEQIRQTFSGFRGLVGQVFFSACLLERDSTTSTAPERRGSDAWRRRRIMEFDITHTMLDF